MKPGQNIRKGLKARTEALEQAASLGRPNGMAALQEESTEAAVQPSFEDIMDMAMHLDEVRGCIVY